MTYFQGLFARTKSIVEVFSLVLVMLFAQIVVALPKVDAASDECTWTGANNTLVSEAANWTGCDNGNLPEAGDDLLFPSSETTDFAVDFTGMTIFKDIRVENSNFAFTGSIYLSGSLEAWSSATFAHTVTFTNSTGQTGLNIQGGSPVFSGGIDLNVSGSGFTNIFTTNSSLSLPVITGSTTDLYIIGNPTAPIENYLSSTTASTFTTSGSIQIWRAGFTCRSENCLGDNSNIVVVGGADTGGGAYLEFDSNNITFDNPIEYEDIGILEGPSQLKITQNAELLGTLDIVNNAHMIVASGQTATITGNVDVATGQSFQIHGAGNYSNTTVNIDGEVTGEGDIYTEDASVTFSEDNNTYTGTIYAEEGTLLRAYDQYSLGAISAPTFIASGASYFLTALTNIENNEPLTISGTGLGVGGYNGAIVNGSNVHALYGDIILDSDTTVVNWDDGNTLSLRGAISGTGDFTFAGYNNDNAPFEIGGSGAQPSGSELMGIYLGNHGSVDNIISVEDLYIHDLTASVAVIHAFIIDHGAGMTTTANIKNTTISNITNNGGSINNFLIDIGAFGGIGGTINANIFNTTINNITASEAVAGFGSFGMATNADTNIYAIVQNVTISGITGHTGGIGQPTVGFFSGAAANGSNVSTVVSDISNSLMTNITSNGVPSTCSELNVNSLFNFTGTVHTSINSLGHNISDDSTCTTFNQVGDQLNVPNIASTLGPLQNNGGFVPTMALLPGSPAIATGGQILGISTDARGVTRPSTPDVGAYQTVQGVSTSTPNSFAGLSVPNSGYGGKQNHSLSNLLLWLSLVNFGSLIGFIVSRQKLKSRT